jgi:hypothetical protein
MCYQHLCLCIDRITLLLWYFEFMCMRLSQSDYIIVITVIVSFVMACHCCNVMNLVSRIIHYYHIKAAIISLILILYSISCTRYTLAYVLHIHLTIN